MIFEKGYVNWSGDPVPYPVAHEVAQALESSEYS